MKSKSINQLLLASLLTLFGASAARAQQAPLTLNLSNTDGNGNTFDGVVFFSGNQFGDASIYARFGGNGTRYFEVLSPGENKNVVVQQDDFFNIRPTGNYVVDRTKVLKFNGLSTNINGSVSITARQLAISTYAVQESQPTPGARITTTYQTGAGTYPAQLTSGYFGVQLLNADGGYLRDLDNPNDMNGNFTPRESFGYSKGDIRNITASLPANLAPGTYRVRVVTTKLNQNVIGTPSAPFTIAAPQVSQVSTRPTSINPTSVFAGEQIILNADVTDDGLLGIRETPTGGGKYWVSYYDAKTNQPVKDFEFQTYNEVYTGTVTTRPSGVYTANNKITGPITVPLSFPPGDYYCRIFVGADVSNKLNPNNAGNSPTFTVKSNASITVGNVNSDVCQGSTMSVPFTYNGTSAASPYNVILVDANTGTTVVYLSTSASSSPTTVQIPSNLSGKYKVTVRSMYFPNIPANSSNEFTIRAKPTLTLSNTQGGVTFDGNVFRGGPASIAANANSDSPWSMNYFDPESGQMRAFPDPSQGQGTSVSGQKFFYPNPVASGAYGASNISGFKNQYCDGTVSGAVNINVKQMAITTGNPDPPVLCGGATIKIPMTTNGPGTFRAKERGAVFVVQLLDNNGGYLRDLPTGGGFGDNYSNGGITFTADIPGDLPNGQYKTRVFFKNGNPDVTGSASGNLTISRAILPTVTKPEPVCQGGGSVQLQATGSGTLRWFDFAGTPLSGAPVQPAQKAGDYGYFVSQNINGCESDRVSVVVVIKPTSSPPGDVSREFCQNEPPQTLTTNAQNPLWYEANGTTQLPSAPAPPTGTATTLTYKLSQETNGCRSGQSTITVRVKPLPAAPGFTPPDALCQFGPTRRLTASGDGLRWYRADGSLIGTDAPEPGLGSVATQTYQVSQTKEGCEGPKAKIDQPFKASPVKPTVTPLLLCRADPQTPVSATALPGHKLNWYGQNETGGTASPASPTITTGTTLNTNYYVSQTLESTSCESLRQAVSVVVADAPPAPSVNAVQQVCLNTTPTALTAGGNGLFWTASAGGGLTSPTVNPVPPTTTAATFSYTVVQRLGTCVGPASTITFTVRPLPAAPAVRPLQVACINDPSFALSATALAGHKLTWYDSQQRTNPQSSVTIQTGTAGTKNWFATQTDNIGCESPVSPQTSRVLAKATARLYGDGEVYFFDSTAVRIQFGGEGPWTFTLWNDKTITNNLINPLVVWVPPTTVTRTYELKALSNECGPGTPSNKYEVRIINRPVVTAVDPGLPDASLMAYPNPASADVRVSWRAASRSSVVLRVLSLTGSVVWQVERTATGAEQTELVPAGLWAAGVYTLQLQTGNTNALESRLLKL